MTSVPTQQVRSQEKPKNDNEQPDDPKADKKITDPKIKITKVEVIRKKEKGFDIPVTRVRVQGTTNLPDDTLLMVRMIQRSYNIPFLRTRGMAKGGKFDIVMGPYERPLFPDTYLVSTVFFPDRQKRALREKLDGLSTIKVQILHSHQSDKVAAARAKAAEETDAALTGLEECAGSMVSRLPRLRALDKLGRVPTEGKAREAMETFINLWDLKYERLRKGNDERLDEHLILPYVQTEKQILRLINLLMDFQFEYRGLLKKGDREMLIQRNLDQLDTLVYHTRNWFRYERIARSADPVARLRTEIVRLGKQLVEHVGDALPAAEAMKKSLDRGSRVLGDERRLVLYRQILHWDSQHAALAEFMARSHTKDEWVEFTNDWLMAFRGTHREFNAQIQRNLGGVKGVEGATNRVAIAALLEMTRLSAGAKHIAVVTAKDLAPELKLGERDALLTGLVDRFDLRKVHQRAIRNQYYRFSKLASELARQATQALKIKHFTETHWDEFRTLWESSLLKLFQMDLPGVGPLKDDKKIAEAFESDKAALNMELMRMMQLKVELETQLLVRDRKTDAPALAAIKKITTLGKTAKSKSEAGE